MGVGVPVLQAREELMGTNPLWTKPVEPATTGPALVLVFVEELVAQHSSGQGIVFPTHSSEFQNRPAWWLRFLPPLLCHAVPGTGSPECHPVGVGIVSATHQGWQQSAPSHVVSQPETFQTGLYGHSHSATAPRPFVGAHYFDAPTLGHRH